tara:strand:+ start:2105 stop:2599 length:495 start_codon:yes stop_codon:yes gene_type:complete
MNLRVVFISLVFLVSLNTSANEEIDKLTLPVLEAIQKGDVSNIFSMAFPKDSPTRDYFSKSEFIQLDAQFESSFKTLGKAHGYFEYLVSDIPDVFMIKYYVVKFERQPALIKFRLYKTKNKWRVNAFELDDTIQNYLEESAKYRLGTQGLADVRAEIKANKSLK